MPLSEESKTEESKKLTPAYDAQCCRTPRENTASDQNLSVEEAFNVVTENFSKGLSNMLQQMVQSGLYQEGWKKIGTLLQILLEFIAKLAKLQFDPASRSSIVNAEKEADRVSADSSGIPDIAAALQTTRPAAPRPPISTP